MFFFYFYFVSEEYSEEPGIDKEKLRSINGVD